jgi:RNA polymerase sigma-70 factor, ECF subfamily
MGVTVSVPSWTTLADRPSQAVDVHPPTRGAAAQSPASEDDAFAQFYHQHAPRVYMLALRLCGDANDASEVLSETFVSAWRGLPRFRGDSSVQTWLHTIAVRAWRSIQRRRGRGRPMVAFDDDDADGVSPYGIAAQYEDPGHRIDIEKAVAALPGGAREILILFAIEGYSHGEIASMLGVKVGTVKSQVHRARKILLERLDR